MSNNQILGDLIDFINQDGKVCPKPREWDELWKMLPGNPDPPLILAAWARSDDLEKRKRFLDQLFYAEDHDAIEEVSEYLKSLKPHQWRMGLGSFKQDRETN